MAAACLCLLCLLVVSFAARPVSLSFEVVEPEGVDCPEGIKSELFGEATLFLVSQVFTPDRNETLFLLFSLAEELPLAAALSASLGPGTGVRRVISAESRIASDA